MKNKIFKLFSFFSLIAFLPILSSAQSCNPNFTYTYNTANVLTVDFASVMEDSILANYEWTYDGIFVTYAKEFTHTFSDPGTYEVCLKVTMAAGDTCETCINICVFAPSPSSASGIDPLDSAIGLYPNPAGDQISLSLTNTGNIKIGTEARITIYDIMGRVVLIREESITAGENTFQLNIKDLPPSTYEVKIEADNLFGRAKFMKY